MSWEFNNPTAPPIREMHIRSALLKIAEMLASAPASTEDRHWLQLLIERDELIREARQVWRVQTPELARLTGLPWTSVLDILNPPAPAEPAAPEHVTESDDGGN